MKQGDHILIRVRGLAFGGDAVGEGPDGRVVFVAGAAPGDEVEVRIEEVKARFLRGRLERVVTPSGERVAPRCPLVDRCGGCQWQEVALAAQQRAKEAIVARAIGRLGAEVRRIVGPTEAFGYRSRARFTIGADGAIGYQGRRTHEVVEVPHCPLLEPSLDAALAEARRVLAGRLRAGGTIAGLAGRRGAVHVAVEGLRGDPSVAAGLVGRAAVVGVVADGTVFGERAVDTSEDGEPPFLGAADAFAQATHAGNRALREVVREEAARGGTPREVLELHAGDGNFTRDLARVAERVLAVEGDRAACERLRTNAAGPAFVDVVAADAREVVRRLHADGARFDVAVLDPPRAGAAELVDGIAAIADRVVYVSCDPMTLARDAAALVRRGLRPLRVTPLDLMPHTYHVECVCLFERSGAAPAEAHRR